MKKKTSPQKKNDNMRTQTYFNFFNIWNLFLVVMY
jgi:hypothetical protein